MYMSAKNCGPEEQYTTRSGRARMPGRNEHEMRYAFRVPDGAQKRNRIPRRLCRRAIDSPPQCWWWRWPPRKERRNHYRRNGPAHGDHFPTFTIRRCEFVCGPRACKRILLVCHVSMCAGDDNIIIRMILYTPDSMQQAIKRFIDGMYVYKYK